SDVNYTFEIIDASGAPKDPVTRPISLVAYQPVLDPESGLWSVDVDFEPGPVDSPFLRFCLARYQSHAIAGCELSRHVALPTRQVHPRRRVEVDLSQPDVVAITVTGPAYSLRYPAFEADPAIRALANAPLLTFALSRRMGPGDAAPTIPLYAADGSRYALPRVAPVSEGRWTARLPRPPTEQVQPHELVLSIYESELFLPYDGSQATNRETAPFVETTRMFACDIPLQP